MKILRVGDDVQLTVLGIKGNQVKIGITAPDNIPVHREEIYRKIQRESQSADSGDDPIWLDEEPERNFNI